VLSIFSGAGALDVAFESSGRFTTRAAIESEPQFSQTLALNQVRGYLADAQIISADVRELNPLDVARKHFPDERVGGVIGGPPCESFSIRGNKRGRSDERGQLVFEFARWVALLQPDFFVMENVPPLVTIENGKLIADLLSEFSRAGYGASWQQLKASDFGAPTHRKRIFIVGFRGTSVFQFPEPTHAAASDDRITALRQHLTVRDALAGLPPVRDGVLKAPSHHTPVKHTPAVVTRFASLRSGQEDPIRHRTKLHPDRPSPSVVAGNLQGTRSHIHPFEPRELTNREVARLHCFPDDFDFAGSAAAVCKQIANAVPIPLGQAVAAAVAQHLDGHRPPTSEA